jgi:Tfp pilus assembly protein PilW
MTDRNFWHEEKGQTLVEAIVAITIAVIIVTALVTLGLSTQRAANTSRNQNQNTRYGEEAIEIIRNIRDNDTPGSIRSTNMGAFTCSATVSCRFNDLFSVSDPSPLRDDATFDGYYFTLIQNGTGGCTLDWCLQSSLTTPTFDTIPGTIYSRRIRIFDTGSSTHATDPSTKVKSVEVTIRWSDASGNHDSVTTTKFTDYKD